MTRPVLAALAALSFLPSTAYACAACARDQSPNLAFLVGALLAVPFALATGVVWAVRRGDGKEER